MKLNRLRWLILALLFLSTVINYVGQAGAVGAFDDAARRKAIELRVVQHVRVLVPVVLGPRPAVEDDERRRVRGATLRKELDGVVVERSNGQRVSALKSLSCEAT